MARLEMPLTGHRASHPGTLTLSRTCRCLMGSRRTTRRQRPSKTRWPRRWRRRWGGRESGERAREREGESVCEREGERGEESEWVPGGAGGDGEGAGRESAVSAPPVAFLTHPTHHHMNCSPHISKNPCAHVLSFGFLSRPLTCYYSTSHTHSPVTIYPLTPTHILLFNLSRPLTYYYSTSHTHSPAPAPALPRRLPAPATALPRRLPAPASALPRRLPSPATALPRRAGDGEHGRRSGPRTGAPLALPQALILSCLCGVAWSGLAWSGLASLPCPGMYSLLWPGLAWPALAWPGLA